MEWEYCVVTHEHVPRAGFQRVAYTLRPYVRGLRKKVMAEQMRQEDAQTDIHIIYALQSEGWELVKKGEPGELWFKRQLRA
jgi:hypothetical protein